MRTIAFVTQKGGSGKSTLASSVAVAAHEAGERVFILDMDPQQSLIKWSKARKKNDVPVEAVQPGKVASVMHALAKNGVTLCIIDTAGTESSATSAAMKAADLCIIPARPNAFDLWASDITRKAMRDLRKEYVFLLNQCPPAQQSARIDEGVALLEKMGGLISPLIGARVDYQEAARNGAGVTEWNASGDAADETRRLWTSIRKRIGKAEKPAVTTRKAA